MIRTLAAAIVLVVLPAGAFGSPLHFVDFGTTTGGGTNPTGLNFNATRALGFDDASDASVDGVLSNPELCLGSLCDFLYPAHFTIEAGPLLNFREVIENDTPTRYYDYGPGTLEMSTSFLGAPLPLFNASVNGLSVVIHDRDRDEPFFPHTWVGSTTATLGPGLFTDTFARHLGVSPRTIGGAWEMDLDDIQFFPVSSIAGDGADNGGTGLSVAVPEPEPFALFLLSGALAGAVRRFRSR